MKTKESIRILKFEDKIGNQSKCWSLSANRQFDQNVDIWVKSGESVKKLTFWWNKVGIDQNVEIWVKNVKINQNIEIWVQQGSINQNVEIWAKKGEIDQMLIFYCQVGIDQNVEIWLKNKE